MQKWNPLLVSGLSREKEEDQYPWHWHINWHITPSHFWIHQVVKHHHIGRRRAIKMEYPILSSAPPPLFFCSTATASTVASDGCFFKNSSLLTFLLLLTSPSALGWVCLTVCLHPPFTRKNESIASYYSEMDRIPAKNLHSALKSIFMSKLLVQDKSHFFLWALQQFQFTLASCPQ